MPHKLKRRSKIIPKLVLLTHISAPHAQEDDDEEHGNDPNPG
jgi:hypothetical protein